MEPDNKEKLFCPEFALRLLGCNLEEAKTSGWQSQHGCITGYVCIPKQHGQTMLNWSGQGGVFVQRFKERCSQAAARHWQRAESSLAFRHGGGAWLGLVKPEEDQKSHSWTIFGVYWKLLLAVDFFLHKICL